MQKGFAIVVAVACAAGLASIVAAEMEAEAKAADTPTAEARDGHLGIRVGILVCLLALILATAGLFFQRHAKAVKPIRSIAVLPLQNLSGDPNQEYFVDGMTDELITELAHSKFACRLTYLSHAGQGKPKTAAADCSRA